MAYRFSGTDPQFRASIGAFNGYNWRTNPSSAAMLLKRNVASAWTGLQGIDTGSAAIYAIDYEITSGNQLTGWDGVSGSTWTAASTAPNDTTNWMILGYTWDGAHGTTGGWVWRWKVGAGAWGSENETLPAGTPTGTLGASHRHIIANDPTLADDASIDVVCFGKITSNLSQATFESLDMTTFASWNAVFTGAGALLHGFEVVGSQTDRTGNGGDEVTRNGVTLVSDPAGWSWSLGGGTTVTIPSITRSAMRM